MECPKCGVEIGSARYCGCGWKAKSVSDVKRQLVNAEGYTQCEWVTDGERCRYPGSIGSSTHGGGPNYCTEHFGCTDPQWGGYVVEASRDYVHPTTGERADRANRRLIASANVYLAKHGLQKRQGEDSKAYTARLRAHCRAMFDVIRKRQQAA